MQIKGSEVAQGSCLFIELSIFQVVLDFGPITAREIGIISIHPLFTEKEMWSSARLNDMPRAYSDKVTELWFRPWSV